MGGRTTPKVDRVVLDHLPPKKGRRERVPIVWDDEALDELEAAQSAVVLGPADDLAEARARLEAAEAAAEAATVVFVFRPLAPDAYQDLVRAHPPTDEDVADYRLKLAEQASLDVADQEYVAPPVFHLETFGPALIAAACESPSGLTVEKLSEWVEAGQLNLSERQALWDGAWEAQHSRRRPYAGKGSASTRS